MVTYNEYSSSPHTPDITCIKIRSAYLLGSCGHLREVAFNEGENYSIYSSSAKEFWSH